MDEYKLIFQLKFKRVQIRVNENPDYRMPMLQVGQNVLSQTPEKTNPSDYSFDEFREMLDSLQQPHAKSSQPEGNPSKSPAEYARWSDVLVSNKLEVTYYADVAGKIVLDEKGPIPRMHKGMDIGNGDLPPEWGIEMALHDAHLGYGPWVDRQRAELLRFFFPPTYYDAHATQKLGPGDTRVCTELAILIDFRGSTSLRVPFRQASKVRYNIVLEQPFN